MYDSHHGLILNPLGTFQSILSNGYHGNDDRYKNFDFSFGYLFPSSMTVPSFITIKWHETKLSIIKIFNIFVSDHINLLLLSSGRRKSYK